MRWDDAPAARGGIMHHGAPCMLFEIEFGAWMWRMGRDARTGGT